MERVIERVVFPKPFKPKLKKVAAYARVSSEKDAMLHSLTAQIAAYTSQITVNPNWELVKVYADYAVSGTKESRDEFDQMIGDCRVGKIDMIITKSISRFARNTITLLSIVRELKSLNIDVFFEEQNIHTLSSEGELLLTILASYAQEEARSVSENMKWRIKRNFEKGIPWDGTILGYRLENGEYVVEAEEAVTVKRIFELALSGLGSRAIAKVLNEEGRKTRFCNPWTKNSVISVLKNKTYTGELLLQKTYREDYITKRKVHNNGLLPQYAVGDAHEAIITPSAFDTVQELMKIRAEKAAPKNNNSSLYKEKLICGLCGKLYSRKMSHGRSTWMCNTYRHYGRDRCSNKIIREDVLNELVKDTTFQTITILPTTLKIDNQEIPWSNPSRARSWTPEMKEKARKDGGRRCQEQ